MAYEIVFFSFSTLLVWMHSLFGIWNILNGRTIVTPHVSIKEDFFLLELGEQMINPLQQRRALNPVVSHTPTVARAMRTVGIFVPPKASVLDLNKKRGRCFQCAKSKDNKTANRCSECSYFVCNSHANKTSVFTCFTCSSLETSPQWIKYVVITRNCETVSWLAALRTLSTNNWCEYQ